MKTYSATFETTHNVVSEAYFNADSLKEAKQIAQFHKKFTPEIKMFSRIKTTVKLSRP